MFSAIHVIHVIHVIHPIHVDPMETSMDARKYKIEGIKKSVKTFPFA